MPALVAGIHVFLPSKIEDFLPSKIEDFLPSKIEDVDGRDKPGHDAPR
jgi:hypothetical protein